MQIDEDVQAALQQSWHSDLAHASMQRWLSICKQNDWVHCPQNLSLLATVFGASWYFTRFIFFRGQKIARCFDTPVTLDFNVESLHKNMFEKCLQAAPDKQFDVLCIIKNEIMLSIFLAQLSNNFKQQDIERALTCLADSVLLCVIDILLFNEESIKDEIVILAMGRMAGFEMNFGSDLDLIFLHSDASNISSTVRSTLVRSLMRYFAFASPTGILYEIDMRLRPHGGCGVLVISEESFIDYHQGKREIWERQMMTRCRSVSNQALQAETTLKRVMHAVYENFNVDHLASEIIKVRKLVENELGFQHGKFDLKRGFGGIMDIDFLCHYLQLLDGRKNFALRTTSSRKALRKSVETQLIDKVSVDKLLNAYDFMKRAEGCMRVFDMKSVSVFSKDEKNIMPLTRAMGFNGDESVQEFLHYYKSITAQVRRIFTDLVGMF